MRGPGSLNNSGKLFMEHALFIHRLSEVFSLEGEGEAGRQEGG